jgi:hypothetical protein
MLDAQTRSAPNFEWGPAPACKIVKWPGFEGVRLVGPPQWGAHGLNGTRLTTTWEVFYYDGRYIPDTHNGREEPFSAILTPSKTITVHDFVLITGKKVETGKFYLSYFDPCDGTYHFQFAVTHGSAYFKPPVRRRPPGENEDADVAGGGSSGGVGHPPDDSEENQRRQCSKPFIPGICRPFPEDRRQAPSEQELAGDEVILVAENISHDRRKYGFSTYIPQPEGQIPDYYLTQVIRQRLDGGSPESHVGGIVREKVCVQDGSIIQVDRIGNPSYHGLPDIHDPNATQTSWSAQWNVKSYDDCPNQEPDTPGKMSASAALSEPHTTGKFKLDTFQNAWAHKDFFEKTAPHANLVLSKTEDSIQYTKTRYQVRIGADVALPFKTHVIEEFTPEHDPASTPAEKEYRIRNITITTGNKSATYSIDPQSEPDKEGTWRVFLLPIEMTLHRRGTINAPGARINRPADAEAVYEVVTLENADWDEQENWTPNSMASAAEANRQDGATEAVNLDRDDDFVKIKLHCPVPRMAGSIELVMDRAGQGNRMGAEHLRFYDAQGNRIQLADLRIEDLQNPSGPLAPMLKEDGLDLFVEIADLGQMTRANREATGNLLQYADLILRMNLGGTITELDARIYRGGYWRNQRNGNTGTTAFFDGKGRYRDEDGAWQVDDGQLVHGPYNIQSGTGTQDETVRGRGPTPAGWYGLFERTDFRTWWDGRARPQTNHSTGANGQALGYLQQGSYCQWSGPGNRAGQHQHGAYQHTGANPPASVHFKFELVPWGHNAHGRTVLQIHPDGFNDGTAGCVGIQSYTDCCHIFFLLRHYFGTKLQVETP